jgi:NAD(P)-dependent dehydrogenase (short-subunit alcohol dehydrogenase family)
MTSPVAVEPRVALVTGANRGLGLAIARGLARQGLHVVLAARQAAAAEGARAQLADEGLPDTSWQQLDVTDSASVFRAFAETQRAHGRLDVLVNNAGLAVDRDRGVLVPDMDTLRATMAANLFGPWLCATKAIPLMRAGGYGRIVNLSSHMGSLATMMGADSPAYRVSKTALNALTRILAAECADVNILVNAASPGRVATRMNYGKDLGDVQAAAEDLLWLATAPDSGPRGGFFHGRTPLDW